MIQVSILVALACNGLLLNPAYLWLITKLNLNRKPFNCVYCLSWWASLVYAAIQALSGAFNPWLVLVPLTASMTAVVIDRWFNNLPVKFK